MNRFMNAAFFMLLFAGAPLHAAFADEPAADAATLAPVLIIAPVMSSIAHRQAKAPADEYFGRYKISILGVRNVIYDVDARSENASEDAAAGMCRKLILAEEALRDWQTKYPDDTWIPKFGYAMMKDYEKIDSVIVSDELHPAGVHAIDLSIWLDKAYPNSEFAPQ
jgi:hypothetical protein